MADYISREAAIEAFENADEDVFEDYGDGACDWGFGRKNIQEVLNSVPTADVAPVVHGRWIPIYESEMTGWDPAVAGRDPIGGYICSACKEESVYDCNDKFVLSKYCPNCGAKMDLEDENEKVEETKT